MGTPIHVWKVRGRNDLVAESELAAASLAWEVTPPGQQRPGVMEIRLPYSPVDVVLAANDMLYRALHIVHLPAARFALALRIVEARATAETQTLRELMSDGDDGGDAGLVGTQAP